MLGVIPVLLQLKRSASARGAGRGLGCPASSSMGQGHEPWPPAPGHVPSGLTQGAQANPWQVGPGAGHPGWAPVGKRLTGPKASKTGLKASKGTQHRFVKQDERSLVSGECSFPRPRLEQQQGADRGCQARGQSRNPHVLPAAGSTERWEAGRAQAGRAAPPGTSREAFRSRDLQRRLLAAFLDAEREVPSFGIRIPASSLLDGHFSSRTCSSHEAGRGTHRPETRARMVAALLEGSGAWGPDGHGMEEAHYRAVDAEVCVHEARMELPLCLWVP